MQQNKMIADAAEATWDACMWSYNKQQEAQLLEAQMTSAVLPRIVKAGVEAGVEAAIYAVTYNEIVRQTQNGDAKAVTTVVAVSFGAGFVAGSCMEIWRIIEEAIICP